MLSFAKGAALLGDEERAAVLEVLDSRSLFRYYGPEFLAKVSAFESDLATYTGASFATATASGTAALRCALAALGVGCGDEVIVPAFTFIATVNAVVVAGAVPVFAEVDESLGLDAADVAAKITPRTAAVIAVHLENVACDLNAVTDVTRTAGIPLIEDACQALGVTYHGRHVGTFGAFGAYSFQLEKNITAGEGGAVVSDDPVLHRRAARYQDQGGQFVTGYHGTRGDEEDEPFVGENLRMTEIAGAIAGVQLGKLPGLLERMRENHQRIAKDVGDFSGMRPRAVPDPEGQGGSSHSWYLPDPEVAKRFAAALRAEGVPCAQLYKGRPVYDTPSILAKRTASGKGGPWNCAAYPTAVEYHPGLCPVTEALVARSIIVPVGPAWSASECAQTAEAIVKVAEHLLA
jgi:8-amino-3,8-dideoxy-alpha-D-manno-octulosonate transaminase